MILPLGRVATFVFLFVSGAGSLFCSTITSTSCSVTVGTQTSSMTAPDICGISGVSGGGQYMTTASAGIVIGTSSVFMGAEVNVFDDAPNTTATAIASASGSEDFISPGVPRMGFITITGGCTEIYGIIHGYYDYCNGTINFRQGLQTISVGGLECYYSLPCESRTFPFELGTMFSIDASVTNSSSNTNDIMYNDDPGVSYFLSDQYGPVSVSMVPEPTPAVLVGMALLALAPLARLRKYSLLSRLF